MSSKLEGKRVVIVGGSSGLGLGVAKACLAAGASVVISSSNAAHVDKAVERLRSTASTAHTAFPKAGVTVSGRTLDANQGESAVKAFFDGIGNFDHLVWTAGGKLPSGYPDMDLANAAEAFNVRTLGPLWAGKYAPAHMPKSSQASITLTIGAVVRKPEKGWSLVAAVMGATERLGKGLAVDLAPIRVNVVSPGLTNTERWDVMSKGEREGMYKAVSKAVPVQHVPETEEIAESYLYAMKCGNVTGEVMHVDGGYTLAWL